MVELLLLLQVYKMVMSIGWNPFYNNTEKTAEPWLLHDFDQVRGKLRQRQHDLADSCIAACCREGLQACTGVLCRQIMGTVNTTASCSIANMCSDSLHAPNPAYCQATMATRCFIVYVPLQPFYDQEIRLVVCGYVRPEANFTSLEALVQRIHKDAEVSKAALSHPQLQGYAAEAFLQPAGKLAAAAAAAGGGAGEAVAELEEVAVAASG
jgi:hypothetical protein